MRLAQAKLAIEAGISDFVKETDFDNKLKNINKKATSNKTKYVEANKKLTDLTKTLHKYQNKDMIFCQVECILQMTMVITVF